MGALHKIGSPLRSLFFAVLTAALCLWATIPYGSAAPWAQALIAACCMLVFIIGYALSIAGQDEYINKPVLHSISLTTLTITLLALWVIIQGLPLPVKCLSIFQPFSRDAYFLLFDNRGFTSISLDPFLTRSSMAMWTAYGLLVWIASRCLRARNTIITLAYMLIGIGTFQAFFAIFCHGYQLASGNPFVSNRLIGTFSSGNSFGGFLSLTLAVTFGTILAVVPRFIDAIKNYPVQAILVSHHSRIKLLTVLGLLSAFIAQIVALILSGSRGAIISSAISLGFLLLWFIHTAEHKIRRGTLRVLITAIVIVLVLGVGGAYGIMISRFGKITLTHIPRFLILLGSIRMLAAHPLGVGLGCFGEAFTRFQPPGFTERRVYHAHNDYIQLMCELGIPGIILMFWLFRLYWHRIKPLILDRPQGYSIWIWRGALSAVTASALHALVDFNITSRPGVAVTFFVLTGITLGYHSKTEQSTVRTTRRDRTKPTAGRLAILMLICIIIIIPAIKHGRSFWLIECGRSALMEKPDNYLWLSIPPLAEKEGIEKIQASVNIAPTYGWTHYTRGMSRITQFEIKRNNMVQDNLAKNPGRDEDSVRQSVHLIMRNDEADAYASSADDFRTALSYSRWSPDILAGTGRSLIESAIITYEPEQAVKERMAGIKALDMALHLAPNDIHTLSRACRALSIAIVTMHDNPSEQQALRAKLGKWGQHALWLKSNIIPDILASLSKAGIPVIDIISAPDTPLVAIWQAYCMYSRNDDSQNAVKCLDLLENACNNKTRISASRRHAPTSDTTDKYANLITRERSKWFLKLGDWANYRAMSDRRKEAYETDVRSAIESITKSSLSDDMLYLNLNSIQNLKGLDPSGKLMLCRMELIKGRTTIASRILTEVCLQNDMSSTDQIQNIINMETDLDKVSSELAKARILIEHNEHGRASVHLNSIIREQTSFRFKHRVWLLYAQCLAALNEFDKSKEALFQSIKQCSTDPDAITALLESHGHGLLIKDEAGNDVRPVDLLSQLIAPYGIGMRFLGNDSELTGIDITQTDNISRSMPNTTLRTFWRFSGTVPSDLEVVISLRTGTGKTIHAAKKAFFQIHPLVFSAGFPQIGSVMIMEFNLPLKAQLGTTLVIGLQRKSANKWLSSMEGLPYAEINNWQDKIRKQIQLIGRNAGVLTFYTSGLNEETALAMTNYIADTWSASCATPPSNQPDARAIAVDINIADNEPNSGLDMNILGRDGYSICVLPDGISISALDASGLQHGINSLFKKVFGHRWFLPNNDFKIQPKHDWLFADPIWIMDTPAYSFRAMSTTRTAPDGNLDDEWKQWNGLSNTRLSPQVQRFHHNIHNIFDPDKFYQIHPEWYPLLNNSRPCPRDSNWQICLSAKGIAETAISAARQYFADSTNKQWFSLSINDSEKWCECHACEQLCPPAERRFSASNRWWSEPYWMFVNKVASNIRDLYPDRRIGALAYSATVMPPSFHLETNVSVFVCQDAGGYFDTEYKNRNIKALETWCNLTSRAGKYGYTELASWIFPRYCRDEIADDIKIATSFGINDFYTEGLRLHYINGPLSWIAAQLLWNPCLNQRELQQEFCDMSFGPASKAMMEYFDTLQTIWQNQEKGIWFDGLFDLGRQAERYPEPVRQQLSQIIQDAYWKARENEFILKRISAVYEPLAMANCIAEEAEHMAAIAQIPRDQTELDLFRANLQALDNAITKRNEILDDLNNKPWGQNVRSALNQQGTIDRWNKKQQIIRIAALHFLEVIENAMLD